MQRMDNPWNRSLNYAHQPIIPHWNSSMVVEGCRRAGLFDEIAEKRKMVAAHDSPIPEAAEGHVNPLFGAEMT